MGKSSDKGLLSHLFCPSRVANHHQAEAEELPLDRFDKLVVGPLVSLSGRHCQAFCTCLGWFRIQGTTQRFGGSASSKSPKPMAE